MTNTTLKDIAKLAGVSEMTVSLSFRKGSRIGDKTRAKVLAIAEEHNYIPNIAAQNLRNRKSNLIGIIVPDITDTFFATLIRETERVLQQHGYQIISGESQWLGKKEKEVIEKMAQFRIEGMLFCSSEDSPENVELFDKYNIPNIFLDTLPKNLNKPYVINDFDYVGYMAAEHFINIGCKKIAFINGDNTKVDYSSLKKIKESFINNLTKNNIEIKAENIINAGFAIEDGKSSVHRLLTNSNDIDGIFCINDYLALGAMESVESHGKVVGKDIAVMGIDDIPVAKLSRISLTSIKLPYKKIAETAANALIDSIENKTDINIQTILTPELIIRESTRKFKN